MSPPLPALEADTPLTADRVRQMIGHLNYWVRSELALECIRHDGRCPPEVAAARQAAATLNGHLHAVRKRLDGTVTGVP